MRKMLTLVLLMLVRVAFAVEIPDPNLRTIIESNLGGITGTPITADKMATLTHLNNVVPQLYILGISLNTGYFHYHVISSTHIHRLFTVYLLFSF